MLNYIIKRIVLVSIISLLIPLCLYSQQSVNNAQTNFDYNYTQVNQMKLWVIESTNDMEVILRQKSN